MCHFAIVANLRSLLQEFMACQVHPSRKTVFKKQKANILGHAVAQWFRYCVTNRKVAGSIPDGVIGIFH
jgi:hypothetical protein